MSVSVVIPRDCVTLKMPVAELGRLDLAAGLGDRASARPCPCACRPSSRSGCPARASSATKRLLPRHLDEHRAARSAATTTLRFGDRRRGRGRRRRRASGSASASAAAAAAAERASRDVPDAPASQPAPCGRAASVWSSARAGAADVVRRAGRANGSTSVCPPESREVGGEPGADADRSPAASPQSPTESTLPPLLTGARAAQFDGPGVGGVVGEDRSRGPGSCPGRR